MPEILKRGDIGHNVYRLQRRLNIFATGYFDDRTAKAVKRFQATHKLKVDGAVVPDTRKELELKLVETKIPFQPDCRAVEER